MCALGRVLGFVFLWAILLAEQAHARVEFLKINDLAQVATTLKNLSLTKALSPDNTLFVFDLDETVFTFGGAQSTDFESLRQRFLYPSSEDCAQFYDSSGTLVTNARRLAESPLFLRQSDMQVTYFNPLTQHVESYHRVHMVQANAAEIIYALQEKVSVMALTARYAFTYALTERQLQANDISFAKSAPKLYFDAAHFLHHAAPVSDAIAQRLQGQKTGIELLLHKDLAGEASASPWEHIGLSFPKEEDDWRFVAGAQVQYILLPAEKLLTPDQMHILGVDPEHPHYAFTKTDEPAMQAVSYHAGIIHSANNNKGLVLKSMLAYAAQHFSNIVVVDDKYRRLQEIAEAFADDSGIDLMLLHYKPQL